VERAYGDKNMSHNERNSPSKAVKEEKLTKIMKRAADVIV
jgi:hypothetical protein